MSRIGRLGRLIIAIVTVVTIALSANVVGLARYPGGPLREVGADGPLWLDTRPGGQDQGIQGFDASAGIAFGKPLYSGILVQNASPWPAAIERISLVDATPGLSLVDARLALPGSSGTLAGLIFGDHADLAEPEDYGPLPATLPGLNVPDEGRVLLTISTTSPGHQQYRSVAVEYRIGPFAFRAIYHQAVSVCLVPVPDGAPCGEGLPLEP
jgi:hypothetical protein